MKFKQLLFAVTLVTVSSLSFGQSNQTSEKKAELKKATRVSSTSNRPVLNTTDGYMGKKEAILERLIANTIPADFPKYNEGLSKAAYKLLMKDWAKKNPSLVKEKYRNK